MIILKVVRVFKNKKTVHTELHCDAEVKFIISMDEDYVIAIDRMNNLKCWLIETGKNSLNCFLTFANRNLYNSPLTLLFKLNHMKIKLSH